MAATITSVLLHFALQPAGHQPLVERRRETAEPPRLVRGAADQQQAAPPFDTAMNAVGDGLGREAPADDDLRVARGLAVGAERVAIDPGAR